MDATHNKNATRNEWAIYCEQVDVEEITIDGSKIDAQAGSEIKVFVHRPKSLPKENRPAMVFAHGGGAILCSAGGFGPIASRYAVEGLCTVFNVDYRLAPEHKAPAGLYDMYAVLKHVHLNASTLGVDKNKIGMFGESGGGYITAGAGLILAEKNESHMCKFQIQQIPMVGTSLVNDEFASEHTKEEASLAPGQKMMTALITKDSLDVALKDPYVFPNVMSDEMASKVPPVVVYTAEFDFYRRASQHAADLYKKNGTLLHHVVLKGYTHAGYVDFTLKKTSVWYSDFGRLCKKYLDIQDQPI